ncbi:MAG: TerB family tellurite resistance protein [Proteobacteria bacterium]|nr:TerB family tellurite resistance protein [Pseudomonadota bacterium]
MIKRLFDQLVASISAPVTSDADGNTREAALRMATAVLMIDVARADHVFDESELERVLQLVAAHFRLSPAEAAELVSRASDKAEELTSAYEFTRVLHQHLDVDEEARMVGLLWQVAYADGQLDKYEDSLVLKISDLLHVSRARVMRLKHDAKIEAHQRKS